MTKHRGDLRITNENIAEYQDLTEVSGYVDIRADNASLPALLETITATASGYEFQWGSHTMSAKKVFVRSTVDVEHSLAAELGENIIYHAGCFHGSYKAAVERIGGRADYTEALKQIRKSITPNTGE